MTLHYQFVDGNRVLAPLLLLHGDGGSERDLLPIARFIAPGAPQLSLRGRVSENGQTRFFKHPADGIDSGDLTRASAWLQAAVATLADKFQLPLARMIVVGYSNGGNLAIRTMMTQPLPFRTALLFHPQTLGPLAGPRLAAATRIWASYGTADPIVTKAAFTALETQITAAGAQLTTFTHDERHNLNLAELRHAKQWLAQSGRLKEEWS